MATEVELLFQALQKLTEQVQSMAANQGGGGPKQRWDAVERYKNLKIFDGNSKDYEEFSTKLRSQVAAGDPRVERLMRVVETDCTEDMLAQGKYNECSPEFNEDHEEFIIMSASQMYNLLLIMTTGEANAMVRRCQGQGWLVWKKLTSSLNPRTLASGIKAISSVLSPGKIHQATKADNEIEQWEDRMVKLSSEYGQELSAKMKVAVLYSMLPKDLQERVIDECAVNWDETPEHVAGALFTKVKGQIKNIAKSRREMSGPKPMEVDAVTSWEEWSGWGEHNHESKDEHGEKTEESEEAYVQFIGKGGKKGGGKGFQGKCYSCGEFGHSQWDCWKGKGKGKGYGKDGDYGKGYDKGYGKGYGKDGVYGKGYDKGNGKGYGKGGMPRACFGCGSTEHLMRDCPRNPKIQSVEDETPEVLFIGNVQKQKEEEWRRVPMKVTLGDFMRAPVVKKKPVEKNRFKVLEVGEDDDDNDYHIGTGHGEDNEEVMHIRTVEKKEEDMENMRAKLREEVQYVQAVSKDDGWLSLGVGDIIVDSAADESCWPAGQGDAFPTVPSSKRMILKTANGGDMGHYGQKEVLFKCGGIEGKEPMGLTFQVTDVRKPLLAVRRLVEKGNKVVLAGGEGESYIYNEVSKIKVPIKKKGGSFVIEAHFVKRVEAPGFARPA